MLLSLIQQVGGEEEGDERGRGEGSSISNALTSESLMMGHVQRQQVMERYRRQRTLQRMRRHESRQRSLREAREELQQFRDISALGDMPGAIASPPRAPTRAGGASPPRARRAAAGAAMASAESLTERQGIGGIRDLINTGGTGIITPQIASAMGTQTAVPAPASSSSASRDSPDRTSTIIHAGNMRVGPASSISRTMSNEEGLEDPSECSRVQ